MAMDHARPEPVRSPSRGVLRDRIAHLGDDMEDTLNGVAHLLHLISAIDPRTRKDREALAFAAIEIDVRADALAHFAGELFEVCRGGGR
ncbi:MAG TPA: hypothetical protein VHZ29_02690 [Rhizomicrobium sp.]|nr:hypothetical protein [Rhizomicrobium sp.]